MSNSSFTFPPPPPPPPKKPSNNPVNLRGAIQNFPQNRGSPVHNGQNIQRGSQHNYRGRRGQVDYGGFNSPAQSRHLQDAGNLHKPRNARAAGLVSGLKSKRSHDQAFDSRGQYTIPKPALPKLPQPADNKLSTPPAVTAKAGGLGLIPTNESSSSEDEKDEEIALTDTARGNNLQFEYRGSTSTLRTPAEIAAWVAERKKRYPTQAKREAARKEADERNARLRQEKIAKREAAQANWLKKKEKQHARDHSRADRGDSSSDRAKSHAQSRSQKPQHDVSKTHRSIRDGKGGSNTHRPQFHPPQKVEVSAMLYSDRVQGEQNVVDSESDSSTEPDSDATSSSGTDTDSDSEPEMSSTKVQTQAITTTSHTTNSTRKICQFFKMHGRCKHGSACKFRHERKARDNSQKVKTKSTASKRKGLWQVMVEKEEEELHRKAVSTIISLGKQGLLDDNPTPDE